MSIKRTMALGVARVIGRRSVVTALTPFASSQRLAVVTYHRISSSREATRSMAPGLVSATPSGLEAQLQDLSRRFDVIGADELVSLRDGGDRVQRKPLVMVTFDDGYRDFADVAWPIIRAVGIPVTLFVASAVPDAGVPYWWDRLAFTLRATHARELQWGHRVLPLTSDAERRTAYRVVHDELQLLRTDETIRQVDDLVRTLDTGPGPADLLGWDDIRQLAREGVAVGAHSHEHHRLDRLRPEELARDLATCRRMLADQLGSEPRIFSYPTGYHDPGVAAAVAEAGFDVAFTTVRGVSDLRRPAWLTLPRINVGLTASAALVSLQVLMLRPGSEADPELTDSAARNDTPAASMKEELDATE